jgi:hypothetical protein
MIIGDSSIGNVEVGHCQLKLAQATGVDFLSLLHASLQWGPM